MIYNNLLIRNKMCLYCHTGITADGKERYGLNPNAPPHRKNNCLLRTGYAPKHCDNCKKITQHRIEQRSGFHIGVLICNVCV